MDICMFLYLYDIYVCMCSRRPREGWGFFGAGVTGGYKQSDVGAENWTWKEQCAPIKPSPGVYYHTQLSAFLNLI